MGTEHEIVMVEMAVKGGHGSGIMEDINSSHMVCLAIVKEQHEQTNTTLDWQSCLSNIVNN
jgi:hypothetical protein